MIRWCWVAAAVSVAEEEQVRHARWMLGMVRLDLEGFTCKHSEFELEKAFEVLNTFPLLARTE